MATALTPTARLAAPRKAATMRITRWHQLKAALHRRAGRVEGFLLVVAVLLPQFIITLLGGD